VMFLEHALCLLTCFGMVLQQTGKNTRPKTDVLPGLFDEITYHRAFHQSEWQLMLDIMHQAPEGLVGKPTCCSQQVRFEPKCRKCAKLRKPFSLESHHPQQRTFLFFRPATAQMAYFVLVAGMRRGVALHI
jgi:hypothetical protein